MTHTETTAAAANVNPAALMPMGVGEDELSSWVRRFAECRDRRIECEKAAARLKDGPEKEAKAKILSILAALGVDSVRLRDGLGTVAKIVKTSVTIYDAEKTCRFMFDNMARQDADGLPLSDALILTKTPLKREALAWAEERLAEEGKDPDDAQAFKDKLALLGMGMVTHEDLSYTKSNK